MVWCAKQSIYSRNSLRGRSQSTRLRCRRLFFCPARQNERCVAGLHERIITPLGEKTGPALRVEPEKAPYCVVRRSFGITKLLSSRLAWRFFRLNSAAWLIENAPKYKTGFIANRTYVYATVKQSISTGLISRRRDNIAYSSFRIRGPFQNIKHCAQGFTQRFG